MAITAGTESADRAVGVRVGAVVVALWWAVPFFGIIDLLVGVIPSAFSDEYDWTQVLVVLDKSWGLLFTVLVPVPLIAWAIRPTGWVGPQVVAVAAAVLVAGLAALAAGQIVVALLVAASAAFPRMWHPRPEWSLRRLVATPAFWPVDALVALAFGAALLQAWDVLDTARSGAPDDDNTWGLMHLPMQGGVHARGSDGGRGSRVGAGESGGQLVVRDRAAGRLGGVVRRLLRESPRPAGQSWQNSRLVHGCVGLSDRRSGVGHRVLDKTVSNSRLFRRPSRIGLNSKEKRHRSLSGPACHQGASLRRIQARLGSKNFGPLKLGSRSASPSVGEVDHA